MKVSSMSSAIMFMFVFTLTSCKKPPVSTQTPCTLEEPSTNIFVETLVDESNQEEEEEKPRPCVVPEQDPDANLEINATLKNFDEEGETKMLEALKRLKIVINSVAFKEAVYNHTYQGQLTFVENNGLSNEEIYQKIMEGKEELLPIIDHEIDLQMNLYYKRSSTVGYTYPDTLNVYVNSRFFYGFTYGEVAANAFHEWTHKLGFDHSYGYNDDRPYTVPYALGTIVENLIDQM